MAVASTAADALRHQRAEMDEGVELVLHRCCCERLYGEIKKAEFLLFGLPEGRPPKSEITEHISVN